ncbi:unnamed protein product [Phytophthora lilii]|uniref:Unnamed protein product n=1 Tax=Phytophthora lilii TaxID=2077276 RepID=A0A9W6U558_9STRA|nr:unnamed protein product [Phytophthora lilii]
MPLRLHTSFTFAQTLQQSASTDSSVVSLDSVSAKIGGFVSREVDGAERHSASVGAFSSDMLGWNSTKPLRAVVKLAAARKAAGRALPCPPEDFRGFIVGKCRMGMGRYVATTSF